MNLKTPPFGTGDLTKEWSVLLSACSADRVDDTELSAALEVVDWTVLLVLAEEHGAAAQLECLLKPFSERIPPESLALLARQRRAQALSALAMTAELFPLLERFREQNLDVLVVKGPVLSVRAYSDAGMRAYGDIDLLLRDTDIERATHVLLASGFSSRVTEAEIQQRRIPGEYVFQRAATRMLVELHTERSLRFFPKQPSINDYFSRRVAVIVDGRAVSALSPEDELVHICVHGAKHLWERLMWVADVAAILARASRQESALDWELVHASARSVGAERMLALGLQLAADVLRAPLPERLVAAIRSDRVVARIAADIRHRLPFAGYRSPGIAERAAFRMAMRGGGLRGLLYLWRLTVSPTERDWQDPERAGGSTLFRRLRRLVREYRRRD